MKKYALLLFMSVLTLVTKAQTSVAVQNFTLTGIVTQNGNVHVEYDMKNTGSTNITGSVYSYANVNGTDIGSQDTHIITGFLPPNQTVHISFDIPATTINHFNANQENIVIIWPQGGLTWINDNTGEGEVFVNPADN